MNWRKLTDASRASVHDSFFKIDLYAKERARCAFSLAESLHVPIAAKEKIDIADYIGNVVRDLGGANSKQAFLVEPHSIPPRDDLPIWDHPGSQMLHQPKQVWVHVDYARYRQAYIEGMGDWWVFARILN